LTIYVKPFDGDGDDRIRTTRKVTSITVISQICRMKIPTLSSVCVCGGPRNQMAVSIRKSCDDGLSPVFLDLI
jgi:hypothetical protein